MKRCFILVVLFLDVFSYAASAADLASSSEIQVDPSMVKGSIVYYTHFYNLFVDGHFKKWVDEFKKIYPNVKDVKVEVLTDYRNQMGAMMAAGNYGDVIEMMDNMSRADYQIFYEPLNSLGLHNSYLFPEQFLVDGNYYGFSYGVNADGVVYNKSLFAKAGIARFPRTRTDLLAACKKLKTLGVTPFRLNMALGWPMQQWDKEVLIFAGDAGYYDRMLKDPAPFSRDKPYGKMMSFVRQLIDEGCTEPNLTAAEYVEASPAFQNALADMASNKIGMWFLANWSIEQILDKASKIHSGMTSDDLGFAPLPYDDSGEVTVLMDPDFGLAVSAQSSNKATAKAFLYYLLYISDLANAGGFIPGNVNARSTLPQIDELRSYHPHYIKFATPSREFGDAMMAAGYDFMTGTYLCPPILAKDFDVALRDMNNRWSTAIGGK